MSNERVFENPITGEYHRADGHPGYRCHRCGNGYATAQTRNDLDAHICTGFDQDLAAFTDDQGMFADGYTESDIDNLVCKTAQFVCLWTIHDVLGFDGDSEIIGRDRNADGTFGPWKALSNEFWAYLLHPSGDPEAVALDAVDAFLADEPYHRQDIDNLPAFTGTNAAYLIV